MTPVVYALVERHLRIWGHAETLGLSADWVWAKVKSGEWTLVEKGVPCDPATFGDGSRLRQDFLTDDNLMILEERAKWGLRTLEKTSGWSWEIPASLEYDYEEEYLPDAIFDATDNQEPPVYDRNPRGWMKYMPLDQVAKAQACLEALADGTAGTVELREVITKIGRHPFQVAMDGAPARRPSRGHEERLAMARKMVREALRKKPAGEVGRPKGRAVGETLLTLWRTWSERYGGSQRAFAKAVHARWPIQYGRSANAVRVTLSRILADHLRN